MSFEQETKKISEAVNAVSTLAVAIGALAPQIQLLAHVIPDAVQATLLVGGTVFGIFSRPFLGLFKK